jgi:5-methylthioadenosine/S-adenosylhomocysteine deaminase
MRIFSLRTILLTLLSLPLAAPAQQPTTWALRGTLVLPDTLISNGTLLIRDGVIVAAGEHVDLPANTPVTDLRAAHAIIAPGFLDLHNHLTWNVFPRWHPVQEFGNRYDWQQKAVYQTIVEAPHAALVADGLECAMQRYAELKAITQGETSVVGSLHAPCSQGLARNLDLPNAIPGIAPVDYNVFPFQMTEAQLAQAHQELVENTPGKITHALLIHVAEGAPSDASASREFALLKGRNLLLPGVSLIHAGGLKPENYDEMAAHHVGLIWSPRSNIELYGDTANVAAAKSAGVLIAIAPDWSITGSDGTLGELNYAALWSQTHGQLFTDRDLVRMATVNAAALAGVSAQLGSLAPGHLADLLILTPDPAEHHDAWWSLTHATPTQIALVVLNGQPIYGDPALMPKGEPLNLCGTQKSLLLTGPTGKPTPPTRPGPTPAASSPLLWLTMAVASPHSPNAANNAKSPYAGGEHFAVCLGLRVAHPLVGTEFIRDHRERHAKRYTRHEVTAPRGAGPSGRTFLR